MSDAILFPSKNHDILNYRAQDVDRRFGRAMVNPHYQSITLDPNAEIVCDSGAFQKKDMLHRLTPEQALKRQRRFEYDRRPVGGRPWRLAHYDCLRGVDEEIVEVDGHLSRIKQRGSEATAAPAVALTIMAAEHYISQAHEIEGGLVLSAQGATIRQYIECVRVLLSLARPGVDWLGLGGFCIIGRNRKLIPQFVETLDRAARMVRQRGIEQIHVMGVAFPEALIPAAAICRREGVRLSFDTAGFELQAVNGKLWEARNIDDRSGRRRGGPYRHVYAPHQKWNSPVETPPGYYNPCELLVENLQNFDGWALRIPQPTAGALVVMDLVDFFWCEDGDVAHVALFVSRLCGLLAMLDQALVAGATDVFEIQTETGCYTRTDDVYIFASWEEMEIDELRCAPNSSRQIVFTENT